MLIVPVIGWGKRSGGGGGGYSFNMTAVDPSGAGLVIGYDNIDMFGAGPFGSISSEPISGETLAVCASAPSLGYSGVIFLGDVFNLLSGLTVWVNGVEYQPAFSLDDWYYSSDDDMTMYDIEDASIFVGGDTYFIEIK